MVSGEEIPIFSFVSNMKAIPLNESLSKLHVTSCAVNYAWIICKICVAFSPIFGNSVIGLWWGCHFATLWENKVVFVVQVPNIFSLSQIHLDDRKAGHFKSTCWAECWESILVLSNIIFEQARDIQELLFELEKSSLTYTYSLVDHGQFNVSMLLSLGFRFVYPKLLSNFWLLKLFS